MTHPARAMAFDDLWNGLQFAKAEKLVNENVADGLHLFCYTDSCVYDRGWNPITMLARGVILDPENKRIVATPFPKFFNVGEGQSIVPDLSFETFEKLDGSLIILFHHNGAWRCATKGSLSSDQAKWAQAWIARYDISSLDKDSTYLAEGIYPENRIVVHYNTEGLFLLAAYDGTGKEFDYTRLHETAKALGWPLVERHAYESVSDLMAIAKTLPPSREGFVLRFSDGLRLKVKGDEYCRIHRLISHLTPLAMWESLKNEDDLETVRRELPEEFWCDYDAIIAAIQKQIVTLESTIKTHAEIVKDLSDKEVGLMLDTFPDDVRRFIFPYRKSAGKLLEGRSREAVFRHIRPDANRLDGYTPSYAINRVMEAA